MQTLFRNHKNSFIFTLLFLIISSLNLSNPIKLNAQSIFSNKPQSDANDDSKLCKKNSRKDNKNGTLSEDSYCEYYRAYKNNPNSNDAAKYRNKMLFIVKEQVDEFYNDYKNGRKVKTKWFQTILDILGIGLAFSGTVTNGQRAKTVIGAVSGSYLAGRNSVNDRFQLLQQQILINKMNANRLEQWTIIFGNMSKNAEDYPWESAREQLQQYFFRGNFDDALDSLVTETGADVSKAEQNLLGAVQKSEYTTKLNNFQDYILPMQKKVDQILTDIDKVTSEISALTDETAKTAKQEELKQLNDQKISVIKNYETIWLLILASGDFSAIEEKILNKPGLTQNAKDNFKNFITKIKNKVSIEVIKDKLNPYDNYLALINGVIDDSTLNENFLKILKANKLK